MQNPDLKKEFAARLKAVIDERHIAIADLADASDVNRISIYNYLSGRRMPGLDNAARICNALDISIDWIAGRVKRER